ncbi:MAG: outer membrane protein assembly factor BamD [Cyclobacteriaceae bacterium]|nr:outer membrane protein assembly factor BamD [Cyclobacteriaceae bacterium]
MGINLRISIWVLVGLVGLASCSKFRKIQKSEDWRIKYDAGLAYYEKKDYYHTAILFEEILPIVRGLPEGEKVEYYLAYCQYYEKQYLLASSQFRTFYETYGRSAYAQEAYFMYAYSLYISAPAPNLDQRSTIEGMNAMQNFINQYPESSFTDRANEVIMVSQQKLEKKGYENAKQYLKIRSYKAAVIAFENFRKNFPDSHYLEEVAYLRVVAEYNLAQQSLPGLQLERFNTVISYYMELIESYPDSTYLKAAEKLYSESLNKINKLKNNNS